MSNPGPSSPLLKSFLISLGLGNAFFLIARLIPLGTLQDIQVVSAYGTYDNRRLLLGYAALVGAAVLGPLIAVGLDRKNRMAGPAAKSLPVREPVSIRRTLAGLAAAILVGILLIGPGVAYRALNGHELVHLGYLNEIEHGKILNVDTQVTYGPLLGYSMWAFMKLTRFDLVGFRLYWNVVNGLFLGALLVWAAGWFRRIEIYAVFAVYAVLATSAAYFIADRAGINGGFWGLGNVARQGWSALSILVLGNALVSSPSPRPRFLAGAFVAVSAFYSPETLLPGLITMACLFWSARPAGVRARLLEMTAAAAGGVAVAVPMLGPALIRGRLMEYMESSRHVSSLFIHGFGNTAYPPLFIPGFVPANLIYYVFPAAVIALLWFHWSRRLRDPSSSRLELPLAVYSAISLVNMMVRADRPHWLNVSLTPLLLLFLTIDGWASPAETAGSGGGRFRIPVRLRRLAGPALLLPWLFAHPGLMDLGRGLAGRLAHWNPPPPAGHVRIPGARAGIWTPESSWFDNADWGLRDDPDAVQMILSLAANKPTYIAGPRASLYYFLMDLPCAIPWTDLPSECFTRADYDLVGQALLKVSPDFVFAYQTKPEEKPLRRNNYRLLGIRHGFFVYQRADLPRMALEEIGI